MIGLHIFLFSLITFFLLKEVRRPYKRANYLKISISRISHTIRHIRRLPDLLIFLLSYFFYNDGIYTVIVFAASFGEKSFGMGMGEMIIYFILAQFTSVLGAAFFGWLTDRFNVKSSLSWSLLIWLGVIVWAVFCKSVTEYYFVGLLAGLAIGSSQANSRTMLSLLTPCMVGLPCAQEACAWPSCPWPASLSWDGCYCSLCRYPKVFHAVHYCL